jgi:hypothetical protein
MQLDHQKDFFFRPATGSDQSEVLDLVRKFGGPSATPEMTNHLKDRFVKIASDSSFLFKVALNSNGVIIGTFLCGQSEWLMLAMNPNFMKKEVKEVLFVEVKAWALAADGKLALASKLITGDWKAFVKSQGASIEKLSNGVEQIKF